VRAVTEKPRTCMLRTGAVEKQDLTLRAHDENYGTLRLEETGCVSRDDDNVKRQANARTTATRGSSSGTHDDVVPFDQGDKLECLIKSKRIHQKAEIRRNVELSGWRMGCGLTRRFCRHLFHLLKPLRAGGLELLTTSGGTSSRRLGFGRLYPRSRCLASTHRDVDVVQTVTGGFDLPVGAELPCCREVRSSDA